MLFLEFSEPLEGYSHLRIATYCTCTVVSLSISMNNHQWSTSNGHLIEDKAPHAGEDEIRRPETCYSAETSPGVQKSLDVNLFKPNAIPYFCMFL